MFRKRAEPFADRLHARNERLAMNSKDRVEIHGLPREWRPLDTSLLFDRDTDV